MQNENYIEILKQGLVKKISLLDEIIIKNVQQKQMLADAELDPDDLDGNMKEKAVLIEQLAALDSGFEQVYDRVKEQLMNHKMQYAQDIKVMQRYITEVIDKSTSIQSQEQRNKELILQKFSTVKQQIREVKSSKKAVNQYYSNMMKMNYVDPQFMDSKK